MSALGGTMKKSALLLIAILLLIAAAEAQIKANPEETAVRKLFEEQRLAILHGDTKTLERVLSDDFVVTNPFNQFLTKRQVIERTASGQISFDSFDRTLDYVKVYGDFAIVAGKETGVWGAKSPLPGKPLNLRITAVARRVNGQWVEVARHASMILPGRTPAPPKP
jgi:hypothetical protein